MNLSHVTLEGQDDDTFHLKDKTGSFKVMKKHISPHLLDRIHQHFAEGGEVKEETKAVKDIEKVDEDVAKSDADAAPTPAVPPAGSGGLLAKAAGFAGMPVFTALSGGMASAPLGNALTNYANTHGGGLDNSDLKPEAPPSAQALPPPGTPAPMPPPAAVMPPPQRPVGGPGVGAETKAIDADIKAKGQLANIEAQQAEDKAKADVVVQQQRAAQDAATIAQHNVERQDLHKETQALEADVNSSKIDSHHWWNSRNTGQKISGIIGLVLGGLGTWNGGPNVALQIMQKAAAADVDDQKANLGKKQTRLEDLMKKGHSLQDAEKIELSRNESVMAGLLSQNAAKYGTPPAKAQAAALITGLQAARSKRIDEVKDEQTKRALEQAQIEHLQAEAAKERAGKVLGAKEIPADQILSLSGAGTGAQEVLNQADAFGKVGGAGLVGQDSANFKKNREAGALKIAIGENPKARESLSAKTEGLADTYLPQASDFSATGKTKLANSLLRTNTGVNERIQAYGSSGYNTQPLVAEQQQVRKATLDFLARHGDDVDKDIRNKLSAVVGRVRVRGPDGQTGTVEAADLPKHPEWKPVP